MSDESWTVLISVTSIVVAVGTGLPALWFARRSAIAANKSAAEAARQTQVIADQWHDALSPPRPAELRCDVRRSHIGGPRLWGQITVPRDYRVSAEALAGNGSRHLLLGPQLPAGTHEFELEPWPVGRMKATTEAVLFNFWPPAAFDDADWTCRCGRDVTDAEGTGRGHWQIRVPVRYTEHDLLPSVD